ncbi:MAG: twin-arginine translocase subunit TatC, partial [Acidimicrobiaceae bacterium]|nr:twin-arginine translocase subunit TatC [Acidimicrobiaceae bacterium]
MPLLEHLEELRRRLIRSVAAIAIGTVACWILYPQILDLLLEPYCQIRGSGT